MRLLLLLCCVVICAGRVTAKSLYTGMSAHKKVKRETAVKSLDRQHVFTVVITSAANPPILMARTRWGTDASESFRSFAYTRTRTTYTFNVSLPDNSNTTLIVVFAGDYASSAFEVTNNAPSASRSISLSSQLVIPVKAFVTASSIRDRFDETVIRMDVANANAWFRKYGIGIRLDLKSVSRIASSFASAAGIEENFFCGSDRKTLLSRNRSYDSLALNLYYTNFTSHGSYGSYQGYSCNCAVNRSMKNAVTVNSTRLNRTLAHEVGHFLGLPHVYDEWDPVTHTALINAAALMYNTSQASQVVPVLSKGEAFQANYGEQSGINCAFPAPLAERITVPQSDAVTVPWPDRAIQTVTP